MFTCDFSYQFRDSIVASIPACHAGDRGSIPRVGDIRFLNCKMSFCFNHYRTEVISTCCLEQLLSFLYSPYTSCHCMLEEMTSYTNFYFSFHDTTIY